MPTQNVTIIGSGPAGYTAAIYAARAGLQPVMFAGGPSTSDPRRVPGGQLMITTEVENFPGFPEGVTGPALMARMQQQAERFGTTVHLENVVSVDWSRRPYAIQGESQAVTSEAIIMATGASAKWLDVPGEAEFMNRGVSACATCDGPFYKGRDVLVVGGGDTAMEEATHLAKLCNSVTVVHRRSSLRASKVMQQRALENPKIRFLWDSAVQELVGDATGLTGAVIHQLHTGERTRVSAHGVFVAIGHQPATELMGSALRLQDNGYLWVHPGTARTSLEGVFGCGDVVDATYRQAVTAAGTGCMAALEAERWLTEAGL
jgi:thioredoxin reductase (NADPH)